MLMFNKTSGREPYKGYTRWLREAHNKGLINELKSLYTPDIDPFEILDLGISAHIVLNIKSAVYGIFLEVSDETRELLRIGMRVHYILQRHGDVRET